MTVQPSKPESSDSPASLREQAEQLLQRIASTAAREYSLPEGVSLGAECLETIEAALQAGRAEALREAEIIANFILGWFPGYEDAVHWGSDGPDGSKPETNEVYQAAKRISEHLAALRAAGQETAVVHCGFCQSAPCECPPPDHERP